MHQLSRRSFIKSSAFISLASSLMPLSLLANDRLTPLRKNYLKETDLVFLFQGDSITDGNRGRNNDPNHVMGHGYAFSIASRLGASFPGLNNKFYNRGISGNKVPDLQKRWIGDTIDLKPDVLSILIGINDVAAFIAKPQEAPNVLDFENGYRQLLQTCKEVQPNMLFVLGIPFVYPVGKRKEDWELWKKETGKRAEVTRKLAKEFNAIVVDYPAAFDKAMKRKAADYWIWDGIHPTVFGHEIMAREWIKQVSSQLTFLKKLARNLD